MIKKTHVNGYYINLYVPTDLQFLSQAFIFNYYLCIIVVVVVCLFIQLYVF